MKDRIKCVFYIDKKRKGQSVRKFQKGKRDFFKNFTILSSVLFFCVLHSAIWIPKLQYQSEKSRLSEDIVYSNFFRRQPVSDEVLKKLKKVKIRESFSVCTCWKVILKGKKQSEILQNQKTDGKKQRGGTRMSVSVGQSGMTWNIFL